MSTTTTTKWVDRCHFDFYILYFGTGATPLRINFIKCLLYQTWKVYLICTIFQFSNFENWNSFK